MNFIDRRVSRIFGVPPARRRNSRSVHKGRDLQNFRTLPTVPNLADDEHSYDSGSTVRRTRRSRHPFHAIRASTVHGPGSPTSVRADEILLQLNDVDPWRTNGHEMVKEEDDIPDQLTESDAKRQMQLIFRTPSCWRSDTDQSHLLYLLQQFPNLASEYVDWGFHLFWVHGNEWSTPLCFLLASGASLDTIQLVYELYPAAMSQPQGVHRDLPLHFACRYGASEDVVAFVTRQFPGAVTVPNSSGMLPLHCALGKKHVRPYGKFQRASLNTVCLLVELYPESLLVEEKEKSYTPLQIAFNHGYSFEVIDYMICTMPRRLNEFKLMAGCYHNMFNVHLDLAESELVSKLLPRLKRFRCEPSHWTVDGFIQLLWYLQFNTSINHFDACNIPTGILQNTSVLNAFGDLLEINSTIAVLGISASEEGGLANAFFSFFEQCLKRNHSLETVELSNFCVSGIYLAGFLSEEHTPRVLKLNDFMIRADEDEASQRFTPKWTSSVENLVITGCQVEAGVSSNLVPALQRVLDRVSAMPLLRDFSLCSKHLKDADVTESIVYLLEKSKLIESLTISGPNVNMKRLCRALRYNKTLRRYDAPDTLMTETDRIFLVETLENHNSTVEIINIPIVHGKTTKGTLRRIQYYSRLNQYGRSKLQDPSTTKGTFVNLLQIFNALSLECRYRDKLSVQYGLLRECPSLWCMHTLSIARKSHPTPKKRKRDV